MNTSTVLLKNYTSLKVGGKGRMVVVSSLKELVQVVMEARKEGFICHILGEGTNTFFGDVPNNLLIIKNEIKGISFEEKGDDVFITAFAGEIFDDVISFAVQKGLWGIENLSYIPGTVGAAPVQNIGAYGVELSDVFCSLLALDMKTCNVVEINKEGCAFGYRDSLFKQEKNRYCVISVTCKLSKKPSPVLAYKPLDTLLLKQDCSSGNVRELVIQTRQAKLPEYKVHPNAGSFFKNPVVTNEKKERLSTLYPEMPCITHLDGYKIPAAWLIEHIAAMKGVRVKDVGTWPNQPLVLVNYGEATARDILDFSDTIINTVYAKTGITLEREVNFVE